MTQETAIPPCGLCRQDTGIRFLFEKNGFKIFFCPHCDMGFVHPMPGAEELNRIYALDYFKGNTAKYGYADYEADTLLQSRNFPSRVRIFEKFIPKGRLLDVGCATGAFLQSLGAHWEKYGIEVSKELLKSCTVPPEINIFQGDVLDFQAPKGRFDIVTLFDVLDHVREPSEVMAKVSSLLRPGGIVVILQGDMASLFARFLGKHWHVYIPPTHLWFFTRRGLSRFLEKHGFEIIRVDYEPHWASIELCFFRLSYMFPLKLFRFLHGKIRDTAFGSLGIRFNFYDVVMIYARKKA